MVWSLVVPGAEYSDGSGFPVCLSSICFPVGVETFPWEAAWHEGLEGSSSSEVHVQLCL